MLSQKPTHGVCSAGTASARGGGRPVAHKGPAAAAARVHLITPGGSRRREMHRRLVPLSSRRTAKHRRRGEAAAAKWSVCVSRIEGRTGAPARGATDVATAHKVCACESQPLTLQRCLTSHLRAAAVDGGV